MLSGKKVYICSPLSAPDAKGVSHNMDMARFYIERMTVLYHCRTFASHAYLPLMLDDSIPEERETALRIGMELMDLCDALIICVGVSVLAWRGKSKKRSLRAWKFTGMTVTRNLLNSEP